MVGFFFLCGGSGRRGGKTEMEEEFKASPVVMESFEDRLDRMIAKLDRIEKSRKGLNNSNLLSLK